MLSIYHEDDDFVFAFRKEKIRMNSFFVEFISSIVSHLHQTDPTINIINFNKIYGMKQDNFNKFAKSLITPNTISLLLQISRGFSIDINEEQAMKMRILPIN